LRRNARNRHKALLDAGIVRKKSGFLPSISLWRNGTMRRSNFLQKRGMSTPVLIVDDSAMARKMLQRALPANWDVEITHASNGHEAIAAYRAGKAAVMFLDLTMPDMDGYAVLEALRRENLNCFVVVVSADIQPLAQDRVKQLGAIGFVRKPVTAEKLEPLLKEYGVL
jgi:two-component system, chemotaxis family, chemotaxis protein CheY